jgi:hypothetical protein
MLGLMDSTVSPGRWWRVALPEFSTSALRSPARPGRDGDDVQSVQAITFGGLQQRTCLFAVEGLYLIPL